VVGNFEVDALLHSLPAGHPLPGMVAGAQRCAAGTSWEWDGVRFAVLHPANAAARARKSNDLSCVLKVTAGARSMLLTGDIEKPAEAELVGRDAAALESDALLTPHHGSRTSSTPEFLAAVRASTAVIPVGYRNRFGHPNAEVADRYRASGIRLWRTDLEGAVSVHMANGNITVTSQRRDSRRYWQDAP
jgi:competence protein ComEC